jgi:hypothetical protein
MKSSFELKNFQSVERSEIRTYLGKYEGKPSISSKYKYFLPYITSVNEMQDLNQASGCKYPPYSSENDHKNHNSTFYENLDACIRHWSLMQMNENLDYDDFKSHLEHLACRSYLLLLRYYRTLLHLGDNQRTNKGWSQLNRYQKDLNLSVKTRWITPEIHIIIAKTPISLLEETESHVFLELFIHSLHSILAEDFEGVELILNQRSSLPIERIKKYVFSEFTKVDGLILSVVMMLFLGRYESFPRLNYFMDSSAWPSELEKFKT